MFSMLAVAGKGIDVSENKLKPICYILTELHNQRITYEHFDFMSLSATHKIPDITITAWSLLERIKIKA